MRRRRYLVYCASGALAAVVGLLAASATVAGASKNAYRIGSGLSATKAPGHGKSSPTPTATTSATPPATDTATPTPTDTGTATDPSAAPSPTPSDSTATSPAPNCGGTTVLKADGSAWLCTFDDEFGGTSLDRGKWFVQTTAASGFHSGAECFVDSSNNIAVSNGTLKLTARKENAPFTCKSPSGGYATQYTSGTVNGYGKFAQTYGRFEVRAKLPATTAKGLQETLWLWPVNSLKYGLWPASGEIDFAEFYSQYQGWNIPYLHYNPATARDWSTNTNVYTAWPYPYNQPGMSCSFSPSAFNDYTVVWEPGRITLQVNHKNCVVDNYSASGLSSAAPFDQPFFIALTQALGVGSNAFVDGTTPLPATTEIDYVRIWK